MNDVNEELSLSTEYIRDEISRCESIDELKDKIFPLLKSQKTIWAAKVGRIIAENNYTKTGFSKACGVSRVTIDKWCKGALPKNRETFIRIGLAANYNIDQMNQLLQRYGRYPALYSKSLEDCICIFVLNGNYGLKAAEKYQYILAKIKESITHSSIDGTVNNLDTILVNQQLSEVHDEEELEDFITSNVALFTYAYHKFYSYVKVNLTANYHLLADNVYELAEGQDWSSSLRQCVSAIRQNKWYPTRNKIISLGLHLSMDHDQIDEMLGLAHMEPLCAKNIFESVIMFLLDDASLNNLLDEGADNYDPDELCKYARRILNNLDLPEIESFLAELPEEEDAW